MNADLPSPAAVPAVASVPPRPPVAPAALDAAFQALATYDLGASRAALGAIDEAVLRALGDREAGAALARRLAAVLPTRAPVPAREYACRQLALIGGAESVTALAGLLADPDLAHAACGALQVMPCAEAGGALRDRVPRLAGRYLLGVLTALGARRDELSVPALGRFLGNPDPELAGAAAAALGRIGHAEAARALGEALAQATPGPSLALADACLVCADQLRAAGHDADAQALDQALLKARPAQHVVEAAARGAARLGPPPRSVL